MKIQALVLIGLAVLATGCFPDTQENRDSEIVNQQQEQYAKVQPIPFFDFSMDRDTLIQIYKAKNEARQTHSVVTSQGTGAIIWDCPSIGFPIPADTQLSNPLVPTVRRIQDSGSGTNWTEGVVSQAEPNGLFTSQNTDATYVQCVGPDGSVSPVYTEQKVTTFPFPVKIVDGTIVRDGASSITIDIHEGTEGTAPQESPAQ